MKSSLKVIGDLNFRGPTVAAPMNMAEASQLETDQMRLSLLSKLTEAALVIRSESEQLKATGYSDRTKRLLRILGEAVEEQRSGLGSELAK